MKFCNYFYDYLYLNDHNGTMRLCAWMNTSAIGNLMTDDIDAAYNSEYAQCLRSTMDDQSFELCRVEACPFLQNDNLEEITPEEYERRKKPRYSPTTINMAYDFMCNQSCETCRCEVFTPPANYAGQMEAIHEKLAPYLDTAKKITASGHGDPFASPYMMDVLANMRPENADLEIVLETNGVFFDEAHWQRIKHLGRVNLDIIVTSNSFDEFTYRHISRGGNLQKLLHNLEFMSSLRRNGDLKRLEHAFVIQDRNFREIPSWIKRSFSDEYAFDEVVLRPVYQWGTMDERLYWFKDVLNPCHPYHEEYLEIMRNPVLKDHRVYKFGGDMLHAARPYPCEETPLTVHSYPDAGAEDARFPYEKIEKSSRVVIYGAGGIGRMYMRQIEKERYCAVVCWIDKHGDNVSVMTPDHLSHMPPDSYDYVVLATREPVFQEEMRQLLREAGVPDGRVIC